MIARAVSDSRALDMIAQRMDGQEWDAEMMSDVAAWVVRTGRAVREPHEKNAPDAAIEYGSCKECGMPLLSGMFCRPCLGLLAEAPATLLDLQTRYHELLRRIEALERAVGQKE